MVQRPDVAHVWGDAGDRGYQKMVGALAGKVEREIPSCATFRMRDLVAHLARVKSRGVNWPCGTSSKKNSRYFS